MGSEEILLNAMEELNEELVRSTVLSMKEEGQSASQILQLLNKGVTRVGERFAAGDYFIADLIVASMIYRNTLSLFTNAVPGAADPGRGRIVIGVAEDDIHDIGKDIIVSMLRAEGFEVFDLGIDVKPSRFVHAVRMLAPDLLLLSGMLSSTMKPIADTMDLLREEGLRDGVAVLIGGQCATAAFAELVGADGWAYESSATIEFCNRVMEKKHERR